MVKVSEIGKRKHRNIWLWALIAVLIVGILVFWQHKPLKNWHLPSFTATQDMTYNLPPLNINLINGETLKIAVTLELSPEDQARTLNALSLKINDMIIERTMFFEASELRDPENLYALKENLLYRINLITYPTKIEDIIFREFYITEAKP